MRSGYPLSVDHNGWGVGYQRDRDNRVPNSTTNLLRSIGYDLSQASQIKTAPREVVVRGSPLPTSYCFDYPQSPYFREELPIEALTRHSSSSSLQIDRKPNRPSSLNHGSPLSGRINVNASNKHRLESRSVAHHELQEMSNNSYQLPQTFGEGRRGANFPPSYRHGGSSPPAVQQVGTRSKEYRQKTTRVPLLAEEVIQGQSFSPLTRTSDASNYTQEGLEQHHSSYSLQTSNPKQFDLSLSPRREYNPGYYCQQERIRQEPEPGLMDCCDAKVRCCCSCCHIFCPTGHVNALFTSFVCIGIILFIVFSPLLHYLVPM